MSVHSTVVIDESKGKVIIGKGTEILPYCVIRGPVEIGQYNKIGPFVSIGGPPESTSPSWIYPVIIGDGNSIGEHCIITCGNVLPTKIGNKNLIFKATKISHDTWIEDETIICGANIAGLCHIMNKANLGMNVCVHQRRKIGSYCMIGMGSAVTRDIPPFSLAYGVPCKVKGFNQRYNCERNEIYDKELERYNAIKN